ncbi:hypothetical protein FJR48_01225 [Sulfurimonas lithotrophica]|uniref:Uncharacterized protein n=1 Tax=Sulfurimonas lithotrophica TaxID=2590022 RepID=A0A5P8NYD5_9BACT|nr:hypothetical protein [Sulfurimonas lithotrophica]QFR48414.1 hypothetical protein FJR48_01225 [Sulfurimonas lithotrophica]
MGIEKLFKKVEKFFKMDKDLQEKEYEKKQKLQEALEEKIESLKKKIDESDSQTKKHEHKKQIELMKGFLKELEDN